MSYDPLAIANTLIDIAKEKKVKLTPMKLQKLIYFAHGWNLALKDEPLINEHVEAWKFGPVIPSIYHEFKYYGNNDINEKAERIIMNDNFSFTTTKPVVKKTDKEIWELLEKIWEVYGKYSGWQLSNATHQEGTPWKQVWNEGQVLYGKDIDNNIIKEYFKKISENPHD